MKAAKPQSNAEPQHNSRAENTAPQTAPKRTARQLWRIREPLLPAKAPRGKVCVNLREEDGTLFTRLHLDERLWNAVEMLAAREGIIPAEILNRAVEEAVASPGGLRGFMGQADARKGDAV